MAGVPAVILAASATGELCKLWHFSRVNTGRKKQRRIERGREVGDRQGRGGAPLSARMSTAVTMCECGGI